MLTFMKVLLVTINHKRLTSTKVWISQESQDQAIWPPCGQISHNHILVNQQYVLTKCLLISDRHQCCQILKIVYVHDNKVVTIIVQCDIGVVQDIVQVPCPVELQHKRVKAKHMGWSRTWHSQMTTEDRKLISKTVGSLCIEDPGSLGCGAAFLGH